jgi:hypothetical protein
MAQLLEIGQLGQGHGMAQMKVWRGRVNAQVDSQGVTLGQPFRQLMGHYLFGPGVAELGTAHQ